MGEKLRLNLNTNMSDNLKYSIVFLVVLLICVGVFIAFIRPLWTDRQKLDLDIQQANTKLAALQTFKAQNPDYEALLNVQKAKVADAQKKLPDTVAIPELMAEYSKLADAHDIVLNSLVPKEVSKAGNAFAQPLEMNLSGDYFQLINFLNIIEDGGRFVSINGVSLGTGNSNSGMLNMTARFMVYSLQNSTKAKTTQKKDNETVKKFQEAVKNKATREADIKAVQSGK